MKRALSYGLGWVTTVAVAAGLSWSAARAQEDPRQPAGPSGTEHEAIGVLKQQVSALNAESPDAVMLCFHPNAPDREGMRQVLVNQFRARDLRYELREARFVAEDGPYAYLRAVQRVDGTGEPAPFLGETEELLVFKRSRGAWRAWTSARLDQRRLPLPGEQPPGQPGPPDDGR